jgi:hypothetical protein
LYPEAAMGNQTSVVEERVSAPPFDLLRSGVWLLAYDGVILDQWHVALVVHGDLYQLSGPGKDMVALYDIGETVEHFFCQPHGKMGNARSFAMWRVSSKVTLRKRDVVKAALWYKSRYPKFSFHHDNCHKFAFSLLNYVNGGVDRETLGFMDKGCLKIGSHFNKNNMNRIVPYKVHEGSNDNRYLLWSRREYSTLLRGSTS